MAGENLAPVRRHQHHLLHAHAFAVLVTPGLECDDHPRFEHRLRPRHDARLLVPVTPEAVPRVVRVVEPVARERVEVSRDHTRPHRVEDLREPVRGAAMGGLLEELGSAVAATREEVAALATPGSG